MYCPKCGNQIDDGVQYCPNCGAKVSIESKKENVIDVKKYHISTAVWIIIIILAAISLFLFIEIIGNIDTLSYIYKEAFKTWHTRRLVASCLALIGCLIYRKTPVVLLISSFFPALISVFVNVKAGANVTENIVFLIALICFTVAVFSGEHNALCKIFGMAALLFFLYFEYQEVHYCLSEYHIFKAYPEDGDSLPFLYQSLASALNYLILIILSVCTIVKGTFEKR